MTALDLIFQENYKVIKELCCSKWLWIFWAKPLYQCDYKTGSTLQVAYHVHLYHTVGNYHQNNGCGEFSMDNISNISLVDRHSKSWIGNHDFKFSIGPFRKNLMPSHFWIADHGTLHNLCPFQQVQHEFRPHQRKRHNKQFHDHHPF